MHHLQRSGRNFLSPTKNIALCALDTFCFAKEHEVFDHCQWQAGHCDSPVVWSSLTNSVFLDLIYLGLKFAYEVDRGIAAGNTISFNFFWRNSYGFRTHSL